MRSPSAPAAAALTAPGTLIPVRHRLYRALVPAVVMVTAATQVALLAPAEAAPEPVAAGSAAHLTRDDLAAARITARATGKKVEALGERTEVTQVFANPDGTSTMSSSARPVRVKRADGTWAAIDTKLVATETGYAPSAATVGLTFSRGGSGPLVTVAHHGVTLKVQPPAAFRTLPGPAVEGATATYPEVLPGVDLRLTADGQGYTEVLVVKNGAAARDPRLTKITFPASVSGGALSADAHGNLRVTGKDRKPIFAGAKPSMWDSSAPRAAAGGRRASLGTAVSAKAVSVTPDRKLLTDPTATYPIYIDPGVTVDTVAWSLLESADPDTAYFNTSAQATIGTYDDGDSRFRSLFGMGTKPLNGTHILSASFRIHETGAWDCDPTPFELWSTSAMSSSTTWNDQPDWTSLLGTRSSGAGGDDCPEADVSFPVTSAVQAAADASLSRTWLGIRVSSSNEWDVQYYKQFDNNPVLDVTYNTIPTQPRGLTISDCYVNCTDPRKISAAKPEFRTIVKDGDAAQRIQTEYRIRQGTTVVASGLSNAGTSGSWVSWTPSTALTNGQSYTVSVRGYDGVDRSPWSADAAFAIDTTAPAAATISSSDYPSGAWSKRADQAGSFTLGTNGDFAGFVYGLDENPPTTEIRSASGSATISLTPTVDGPHTLYARSRDAAGNYGPLTSYVFHVGQAALTAPVKGQLITGLTNVQAVAPSTASGYTLQWRRADGDTWVTTPTTDVTLSTGGAVTWPQARVSGTFPQLTWDVAKTFNDAETGSAALDGPVQARVLLPGSSGDSAPLQFTLDPAGDGADTAEAGPGAVNLVTGNLLIAHTDVSVASYGSDLTVARTFNTRKAAINDPASMFGPGWTSSVSVTDAASDYTGLTVSGGLVQVGISDGTSIGFTARSDGGFNPELGFEDMKLTRPDANTYTLSDLTGGVTTFTVPAGSGTWKPTAMTTPGAGQTTTTSYEVATVSGTAVTRPTRLLAPVPAGVTCGAGVSGLVKGCRALSFTYASATTATSTTPGDYVGRVSQIAFTAWDPDLPTPAMHTVVVVKYAYDTGGRLAAIWDPRVDYTSGSTTVHLATRYAYDSNGVLSTLTPVAEQPWQFSYTAVPGDSGKGRLKQVTRSALAAGTARTTVVYRVPTAGLSAPYDLSVTQTGRWGQFEPPAQATAVFGPDQVPDGDQSTGAMPSSYTRARISYLNTSGQTVNAAEPGGHLDATWFDATGNVIRSLTAANRERALGASAGDIATTEAVLAEHYSAVSRYEAGGRRIKETFAPEHDTAVTDGSGGWVTRRARVHSTFSYDQGAPAGDTYDLLTTQVTGARLPDGTDADTRTTTTGYDWVLLRPTVVTVDPSGLNLTSRTTYDATTGLVTSKTRPAGGTTTNTPRTTRTVYYSAGAISTYSECGNHAEWANLACRVQAGGTSTAGQPVPVKATTYDMFGQTRVVTEKTPSGTLLRTTTITYDQAGRRLTTAMTAATGAPLPMARSIYEVTTGLAIETQSLSGTTVTARISRGYDTLGRVTSYTDSDGVASTSTYDLLSRPATTSDGKGTQTYSYDDGTERRGLLTRIVDSQLGTFTAAYDADGNLTSQGLPNSFVVTNEYNEAGTPTARSTGTAGCTPDSDCVDLDEQITETAHGQWATHSTDLSGQEYTYDRAGRLTRTLDYAEPTFGYAGCTIRTYGFDDATNRTSSVRYDPADGGDCQTTTQAAARGWSYDSADRVTSTGYAYDALGRTTAVPSADTANDDGNLTVGYHVNDLVRTLTQAGATTTYTLDVAQDRVRSSTDGTTTSTNHYASDSDVPSWTGLGAGDAYRRNITGPDGSLAAVYDSSAGSVRIQIASLHGDVLGIAANDLVTEPGILATFETDEYGLARDTGDVGEVRYGYLGGYQRPADNPAGVTLMGIRLYNPATGRFLSVDPAPDGSCSTYDYVCADPANVTDIGGDKACACPPGGVGKWKLHYASPWQTTKWVNVTDRDAWRRVVTNIVQTGAMQVEEIHHRFRYRAEHYRRCIAVGWTGPNGQGGFPITRTQEYILYRANFQVKVRYHIFWGYSRFWYTSGWMTHAPSSWAAKPTYVTRPEVWRGN